MDSICVNMAHHICHIASAKIFNPEIVQALNERDSSVVLKKLNNFSETTKDYSSSEKKIPVLALRPIKKGEKATTLLDRLFRNVMPMKVRFYHFLT